MFTVSRPRVLLPAALLLTAILSACGGGGDPAPPEAATVELTGETSVSVGAPSRLTSVVRDAAGTVLNGAVTYTSSQPEAIAVDAQGNLTVKRLTATGQPVTLTASADGQSDTLEVSTYGLELAVGTYVWSLQDAGAAPGRFIAVRYRPQEESGEVQASTYTVTAPGNETLTCGLSQDAVERYCWWILPDATKSPAGEYRASLPQNGVTYETTASLPDPEAVLGFVTGGSATLEGRTVSFRGQPPAEARQLYSYIAKSQITTSALGRRAGEGPTLLVQSADLPQNRRTVSVYSTTLPATLNVGAAVPVGTYDTWITAMSGNLSSFDEILPEQFNVSATFGGKVTLQ